MTNDSKVLSADPLLWRSPCTLLGLYISDALLNSLSQAPGPVALPLVPRSSLRVKAHPPLQARRREIWIFSPVQRENWPSARFIAGLGSVILGAHRGGWAGPDLICIGVFFSREVRWRKKLPRHVGDGVFWVLDYRLYLVLFLSDIHGGKWTPQNLEMGSNELIFDNSKLLRDLISAIRVSWGW